MSGGWSEQVTSIDIRKAGKLSKQVLQLISDPNWRPVPNAVPAAVKVNPDRSAGVAQKPVAPQRRSTLPGVGSEPPKPIEEVARAARPVVTAEDSIWTIADDQISTEPFRDAITLQQLSTGPANAATKAAASRASGETRPSTPPPAAAPARRAAADVRPSASPPKTPSVAPRATAAARPSTPPPPSDNATIIFASRLPTPPPSTVRRSTPPPPPCAATRTTPSPTAAKPEISAPANASSSTESRAPFRPRQHTDPTVDLNDWSEVIAAIESRATRISPPAPLAATQLATFVPSVPRFDHSPELIPTRDHRIDPAALASPRDVTAAYAPQSVTMLPPTLVPVHESRGLSARRAALGFAAVAVLVGSIVAGSSAAASYWAPVAEMHSALVPMAAAAIAPLAQESATTHATTQLVPDVAPLEMLPSHHAHGSNVAWSVRDARRRTPSTASAVAPAPEQVEGPSGGDLPAESTQREARRAIAERVSHCDAHVGQVAHVVVRYAGASGLPTGIRLGHTVSHSSAAPCISASVAAVHLPSFNRATWDTEYYVYVH